MNKHATKFFVGSKNEVTIKVPLSSLVPLSHYRFERPSDGARNNFGSYPEQGFEKIFNILRG